MSKPKTRARSSAHRLGRSGDVEIGFSGSTAGAQTEDEVLSAHRTPKETAEFVSTAESRGVEVMIAAAGGAAHLAGVTAAHTLLPVLGVPMTSALDGLDSLLSTVQMPGGIPVGTLAIAILSLARPDLKKKLREYRAAQAKKVLDEKLP